MRIHSGVSTCAFLLGTIAPLSALDLKMAVVVTPQNLNIQEKTAIVVLVEEVQKRTQMRLQLVCV